MSEIMPLQNHAFEVLIQDDAITVVHEQVQPGGEYTMAHLDGPSETDPALTRLDVLKSKFAIGQVAVGMNGSLSPEAQAWNSENTRLGGPREDYIFRVNVR